MALALKPRLLLLDEPTAGMGDQETYDITQLIRKLHHDQKLTIVLIEHDMRVVFHLADRIMVLAEGKMLAEGTPAGDRRQRSGAGGLSGEGGMSSVALEAEGLHTFYGKSHILHGVGLEVREGEIVTLLGRNGAGKTTTLRSLMGLTHAREGAVRIFGQATTDWPPYRIAALGVGYVPEGRRIFANLTVEENLESPARAARAVDDRPHLRTVPAPRAAQDQQGPAAVRRRTGDAGDRPRAAVEPASCLLLDEPSQGLAPLIVQEVFKVVTAARAAGHLGAAGRAERARRRRNRRPRLRARRRQGGLFRLRRRIRQRRGAGAGAGRRQC